MFVQFRLINRFNYQIVSNRGIYTHNLLDTCNYCNKQGNNIFHLLFECEHYNTIRCLTFYDLSNFNKYVNPAIVFASHPCTTFLRKFMELFLQITKLAISEDTLNFFTLN